MLARILDPLGELPSLEERIARAQYREARARIHAQESLLRRANAPEVEEQLRQAREAFTAFEKTISRGHTATYIALVVWSAFMLAVLAVAFAQLQPEFVEMWQSPDNWYIQHFTPSAAMMWRVNQMLFSSVWFAAIPMVGLALVWLIQRRLVRWQARTVNRLLTIVITVLVCGDGFSLFPLLLRPLF